MVDLVPVKINQPGYMHHGKTVKAKRIDWHGVDCWEFVQPPERRPYVILAEWGRALSSEGKTDGTSRGKAG